MGSIMRTSTQTGLYNLECMTLNIAYGATNEVVNSTATFVTTLSFTPFLTTVANVAFSQGTFTTSSYGTL